MRIQRPSARPALAITALVLLSTSLVVLRGGNDVVNAPVGRFNGILFDGFTNAAVIVSDDDAVAELRSSVGVDRLPDSGPPFVVATVALSGAASSCNQLVVESRVQADGDIHVVLGRPWWIGLPGFTCTEDVPAPGAVIVSIDGRDLAAADRLMVDYGLVGLPEITCVPAQEEARSTWRCGGYPGLGG